MKSILVFCVVLLFFACKSEMYIYGNYTNIHRGPKYVPWVYSLILNNDSTYRYYYSCGWQQEISLGTWHIGKNKNSIVLQSYIQDMQDIPMIVTETKNNKCDSSIFILDNPLFNTTQWTLNVNGVDYLMKGDTLSLDKSIIVNSFCVKGYEDFTNVLPFPLQETIQSETYHVKNASNNVYYISFQSFVNKDIFHYKPIQDSLKLNRKALLFEGIKLKRK
jgi:hypothetical protein